MCPRRGTFFSCVAKKRRQKKATPLSASLRFASGNLQCSRPAGSRSNSLRCASLRQSRALIRWPLRSSAHTEGMGEPNSQTASRAIASLGPLLWAQAPCAGRSIFWVERSDDPNGCFGVYPLLAAPAAGRLRGGMGVAAPMLRHLTRRGCPSGAAQQQSEFHGAPRKRTDAGLPRSEAKGSQTGGRLLLPSFLGDARKEGAPPGAHPGTRPGHRHAAKSTSKPWLRQAQPERIRCELLPCPGFDRLSPNGRGWAASRLRQAQPKWLGITPFAINSIAASAYLISARAIKHIKTQRPAP